MANFRLSVRKVERSDVPFIIRWAKNKVLTKHFHVELPASEQAGAQWFQRSLIDHNRNDFIIHAVDDDGERHPIGMLGVLNVDDINKKAEYYIIIGEDDYTRRGIAFRTSSELISNCFRTLGYNKIFVCADVEHYEAQHLAEKLGFKKEGLFSDDILLEDGTYTDRFIYGLTRTQWEGKR